MKSGGISRVINFLAKRPELDQCIEHQLPRNFIAYILLVTKESFHKLFEIFVVFLQI